MRKGFASRLLSRRRDRGTALIEFTLSFPAICGLLFGMIDGGRFVSSRVALSQAAAEAARTACLLSTTSQGMIDTSFTTAAAATPGATVAWGSTTCNGIACGAWPRATNDVVFLTAQYTFQPVFFQFFSKTLTQTSRMVCE